MSQKAGNWFQRRRARKMAVEQAYEGLMKGALRPLHFEDGGAPDTFEGRAGVVTLHAALLCHRLIDIGGDEAARRVKALNLKVIDGFDAAFREEGVGDSSIARKVRKLVEVHTGMGRALTEAFAGAPDPVVITDILKRNGVLVGALPSPPALVSYTLEALELLKGQSDEALMDGRVKWPGGAG